MFVYECELVKCLQKRCVLFTNCDGLSRSGGDWLLVLPQRNKEREGLIMKDPPGATHSFTVNGGKEHSLV